MTAILFPVVSVAPWWAVLSLWIACLAVLVPLALVGLREVRRVSSSRVRRLVAGVFLSLAGFELLQVIMPCGPVCRWCIAYFGWACFL